MPKKKAASKKSNPSRRTVSSEILERKVYELFDGQEDKEISIEKIFKLTHSHDKASRRIVLSLVMDLEREGRISQLHNGLFKANENHAPKILSGKVDHVNRRFAFVVLDGLEDDLRVRTEDLRYAIDGDTVEIRMKSGKRRDNKPEAVVTNILKRGRTEFVGTVDAHARNVFVIPDNRKMYFDIFIESNKSLRVKTNDKVLVEIVQWHNGRNKSPVGKIVEILGKAGENEAEIHSIMSEFELPFRFPEHIEQAAEHIPTNITQDEIKKRRDMRQVTTFTIDPEDAKDFDDAISIKQLQNNNLEIGIHIADVSHYVTPNDTIDKEAVERATSVYLVDRTIPMLPEKLSNGLCSLRPNEDKLTFSAVFEINDKAQTVKQWFGRTVIHSDRRFTYEEAQERIENEKGDFYEEIKTLNELAKQLKTKRFQQGAINFETVEVKFVQDEKGKAIGVIPKERKDAHKLVEEFMLLANKKVAEFIHDKNHGKDTFVYRVHDDPDPEKLETFSKFAVKFGHKLNIKPNNVSQALNGLMDDIIGKPEQNVLETLAIRTMSKAAYSTETKGHFGLAFSHYSHFTSPIRRYADVMVHRLLQHYLDDQKSPDPTPYDELCKHASAREKRAADAERASIKYKQVEFMESMEDQAFEGVISGVSEWGIYVEMTATKCEGMVRTSSMTDDYYEFDEKNYCIVGKRNKRIFTLGDQVMVEVVGTDINRRTIDLELV